MDDPAGRPPMAAPAIGHAQLFLGFMGIALTGFGGVLPWARRALVEKRRWLTEQEFTEVLSLGQFLPGPNIVNVSICVGTRFKGATGAIVSYLGLMGAPVAIALLLGMLYDEFGGVPIVQGVFRGISAAAAGLVVAMGLKMLGPLWRRPEGLAVGTAAFAAVGIMRLPLPLVLLVLAPVSVGLAWRRR